MIDDPVSLAEEHRRDDLATAARELKGEVAGLKLAVGQLSNRTARAERATRTGMWVSTLLLVVVALLAWVAAQQFQTAQRLDAVVNNGLCPLYSLVVGSYDPATRSLNPDGTYPGSAREKYDLAFTGPQGMNGAYAALRCTIAVVPKRES